MMLKWFVRSAWFALVFAGCVQPGSLDNKEEFQTLLGEDGGPGSGGAGASAAGSGGGGMGGGASGSGGGGAGSATGCAEACEIIAMRCAAGCHSGANAMAGLDLSGDDFGTRLAGGAATTAACTGETLIDEANPENSLLYGKLLDPPVCGIRMPVGVPLDDDETACILRWLEDGARCGGGSAGTDAGQTQPDAGATNPGADAGPTRVAVWIQAEDTAMLSEPLAVQTDAMASGGEYLAVPTSTALPINADPAASSDGIASYTFNVGSAGTYRIWGRVRIATTDNDSFWVRVDDGSWYQWNNIPVGTDWHWDDVHDTNATDQVVDFELAAGQHTLAVAYREIGTELDKILITDDAAFVPMGEGQ